MNKFFKIVALICIFGIPTGIGAWNATTWTALVGYSALFLVVMIISVLIFVLPGRKEVPEYSRDWEEEEPEIEDEEEEDETE